MQLSTAWAQHREMLLRYDGFIAIADADISDDVDAAERAFEDEGLQLGHRFSSTSTIRKPLARKEVPTRGISRAIAIFFIAFSSRSKPLR
jgi:hypothetical protein